MATADPKIEIKYGANTLIISKSIIKVYLEKSEIASVRINYARAKAYFESFFFLCFFVWFVVNILAKAQFCFCRV